MNSGCDNSYADGNTYLTYHCHLGANHDGPHEDIEGPGMRWFA